MENRNKNIDTLHKRWTWRKPKGKPKRPLSAYNIFFADVRRELMSARKDATTASNGIGFKNLAQSVAAKWKDLDPVLKIPYTEKAKLATERYKVELSRWELSQKDSTGDIAIFSSEVIPTIDNNLPLAPSGDPTKFVSDIHFAQQRHLDGTEMKSGPSRTPCQYNTGNQTEESLQARSTLYVRNGVPSFYDNMSAQLTQFQSPGMSELLPNIRYNFYNLLPLGSNVPVLNPPIFDTLQQAISITNGSVIVPNYTGPLNGVASNVSYTAAYNPARITSSNDLPTLYYFY